MAASTRVRTAHPVLAASLLALAAFTANGAVPRPGTPGAPPEAAFRYPVVTASLMTAQPTVDGVVDKAEWTTAARVSGMFVLTGTQATEDATTWWIGYTEDALHVAFRFQRPPYALGPEAEHGGNAWSHDCFELLLRPPGQEVDYDFVVNALGFGDEGRRRQTTDTGWTATWTKSARRIADGWEGELSIPFSSLGETTPMAGATWTINAVRNRKTPDNEVGTSSWLSRWHDVAQYAVLRFGSASTPAARLLEIGALTTAESGAVIELVAPRDAASVSVACVLYRQARAAIEQVTTHAGEILIPKEAELSAFQVMDTDGIDAALGNYEKIKAWTVSESVEAGRTKRLPLAVESGTGKLLLTYLVRDTGSGETLLGGALPFEQRPPLSVSIQKWLLVARCLAVEAEYRRAANVTADMRILAELLDADGEQVLDRAQAGAAPANRRTTLCLSTEGLLGQAVSVRTRMLAPDGGALTEVTIPVQLPAAPEWYPNDIGATDEVLPRWDAIRVSRVECRASEDQAPVECDAAEVVLRTYTFGASGLPVQIVSRGEKLLGAPIELMLGGKTLTWTKRLIEQTPGKVTWSATAQRGELGLTVQTTLEFDGMVRYDLELRPAGTTALDALELSIPYRAAVNVDGLQTHAGFKPTAQLGDYERGLYWFCESARGWTFGDAPAIEQTLRDGVIDWRIRFVSGHGRTLTKPMTLTWGLQALPVRELDNSYQYTERRVAGLDHVHTRTLMDEPGLTECDLRYPTEGNVPVDEGSIRFHWILEDIHGIHPLLRIGEGEDAVRIVFARHYSYHRYELTLAVLHGAGRVAEVFPVDRSVETPWTPAGLSWKRTGETVKLTLVAAKPNGDAQLDEGTLPHDAWRRALGGGELVFGGEGGLAIDELVISREAYPGPILAAMFANPAAVSDSSAVVDPMDDIRFYRANYMTRPLTIANGRGGVAGARFCGSFVELIDGLRGNAVLVPSGRPRMVTDWARSFGATHGVYHEQYHHRHGHYNPPYAPDPLWARALQQANREGWGVAFYNGFGFQPKLDTRVGPFMDELAFRPTRACYDAITPSMARPVADYYMWGWKKAVDEYAVYGQKSDNGLRCRNADHSIPLGFGWIDDEGTPQGTYPFFAARALAKRFYWLFHVYRKEKYGKAGVIMLHAGASTFPFVSAFVDYRAHGESHHFMSAEFIQHPILPEEFGYGKLHHRYGVPVRILTKGPAMPYSPNFLYLYTHLYHMDLRSSPSLLKPGSWHWEENDPHHRKGDDLGDYAPYHTGRPGVHSTPCPQGIVWMLKDEFGCREAEFIPFWRNADVVGLNDERFYASLWLHRGKAALIVVSNLNGKATDVELTVALNELGLAGRRLRVYDALTDDDYTVDGNVVHLTIPGAQYRFIRIEPTP